MGAKSGNFCLFLAYFGVFSPDLWMEYRIFISIVDISANLENIDIDKVILKISISISISIRLFWKISISISNRLEFGISNRATSNSQNAALNAVYLVKHNPPI